MSLCHYVDWAIPPDFAGRVCPIAEIIRMANTVPAYYTDSDGFNFVGKIEKILVRDCTGGFENKPFMIFKGIVNNQPVLEAITDGSFPAQHLQKMIFPENDHRIPDILVIPKFDDTSNYSNRYYLSDFAFGMWHGPFVSLQNGSESDALIPFLVGIQGDKQNEMLKLLIQLHFNVAINTYIPLKYNRPFDLTHMAGVIFGNILFHEKHE